MKSKEFKILRSYLPKNAVYISFNWYYSKVTRKIDLAIEFYLEKWIIILKITQKIASCQHTAYVIESMFIFKATKLFNLE